jgi:hypothetical protein
MTKRAEVFGLGLGTQAVDDLLALLLNLDGVGHRGNDVQIQPGVLEKLGDEIFQVLDFLVTSLETCMLPSTVITASAMLWIMKCGQSGRGDTFFKCPPLF